MSASRTPTVTRARAVIDPCMADGNWRWAEGFSASRLLSAWIDSGTAIVAAMRNVLKAVRVFMGLDSAMQRGRKPTRISEQIELVTLGRPVRMNVSP